jgi:D-psicose/D-tagatose/L-ribulose 3-epimerase
MKLAISNIAWEVEEEHDISCIMRELGVDGVEIAPSKISSDITQIGAQDLLNYKNFWNNKDIEIIAMQSLLYGHPEMRIFFDSTSREKTLHHLQLCADIGEKLGVKALVFGSPKNRFIPSDYDYMDAAKEFFDDIGRYCKRKGSAFCLEPNPMEYGANFLCHTKDAINFVKEVDNDGLKVNIDTGTIIMNQEDYKEILDYGLAYTGHVHISEPFLNPIDRSRDIYKNVINQLNEFDYSGCISIEMKANSQKQNIEAVKGVLKDIRPLFN